jgi:hypothetical protein
MSDFGLITAKEKREKSLQMYLRALTEHINDSVDCPIIYPLPNWICTPKDEDGINLNLLAEETSVRLILNYLESHHYRCHIKFTTEAILSIDWSE